MWKGNFTISHLLSFFWKYIQFNFSPQSSQAMEEIVIKVDEVDALTDRKLFVEKYGTGSLRPVDMTWLLEIT